MTYARVAWLPGAGSMWGVASGGPAGNTSARDRGQCIIHSFLLPAAVRLDDAGGLVPAVAYVKLYPLRSKNVGCFDFSRFIYFVIYLDIYYI